MKKIKWKNILVLFVFVLSLTLFGCNKKEGLGLKPFEEIEDQIKEYNLSVFAVGDALIHGYVYMDARKSDGTYDFTSMFSHIKEITNDYDLAFYNQESSIGGSSLGYSGYPRFNSPQEIGENLVDLGFNLVALSNNHTMDKGVSGAKHSANFWANQKSVLSVGSYTSQEERDKVVVKEKNGITYTLLAYTTVTNGLVPPAGYEYLMNVYNEEQVKKDIAKVRDLVDVVMVSMHWGEEDIYSPNQSQQDQAKFLAGQGVDVVIGHHSHTVQPITFIDDTLVIYSLGNFISNQKDVSVGNNIGLMVGFNINKTVEKEETKISITEVKGDLFWVHSYNHRGYEVVPFNKVTNAMLNNKDSVYSQYSSIINKYNNGAIKVGAF